MYKSEAPYAPQSAEWIARLYSDLHAIAARMLASERSGHTLQPTALVHELYLRFEVGSAPDWRSRRHFMAVAASTLRRILIDHARARNSERRGGGAIAVPLESVNVGAPSFSWDELLAVDESLRHLELADPRAARVTELRFFAGLQEKEIAEELGISEITVKRDWKFARAFLAALLASH